MERQPLSTSVNNRDSVRAIRGAVQAVRSRIEEACLRSGRDAADVRLIGVTKEVGAEYVEAAAAAGLEDFGENYMQELEAKRSAASDATWHFLGRIQANKLSRVVAAADVIHTLEPGRAVEKLARRASAGDELPECLIEVDFTGGRVGVPPEQLPAFADELNAAGVPVKGLMTVAPPEDDPRPWFSKLRRARNQLREQHEGITELSMGMSADLEVAVEEGATMVRVGRAIFGPRRR